MGQWDGARDTYLYPSTHFYIFQYLPTLFTFFLPFLKYLGNPLLFLTIPHFQTEILSFPISPLSQKLGFCP